MIFLELLETNHHMNSLPSEWEEEIELRKVEPRFHLEVLSLFLTVILMTFSASASESLAKDQKQAELWSLAEARSFSVQAIYGQQNYQLLGAGFTADSMGSNLNGYVFDWMDLVGSQLLQLEWSALTISSKVPSGLLPSTTKQKIDKVRLQAFSGIGESKSVYFGYGLFYQSRRLQDETTPNAIFLSSQRYGPQISVLWADKYNDIFGYWFDLGFSFPAWFEELNQSSGSIQYSFIAETKYLLVYHVNDIFDASVGVKLQMENNKFKHTGSRGTIDADERFYNIEFPVQLRARF